MDRKDDEEDETRRNATLLLQSVMRNRGNQRDVKLILEAKADPNYFNDTHNKIPLLEAIMNCKPNIVKLLVQHKADVNAFLFDASDRVHHRSAIYLSAFCKSYAYEISCILLTHGAVLYPPGDEYWLSPLYQVLQSGNSRLLCLLHSYGLKLDETSPREVVGLASCPLLHNRMAEFLIEHGCELPKNYLFVRPTVRIVELLHERGVNLDGMRYMNSSETLLGWSLRVECYDVAKALLNCGVDPNGGIFKNRDRVWATSNSCPTTYISDRLFSRRPLRILLNRCRIVTIDINHTTIDIIHDIQPVIGMIEYFANCGACFQEPFRRAHSLYDAIESLEVYNMLRKYGTVLCVFDFIFTIISNKFESFYDLATRTFNDTSSRSIVATSLFILTYMFIFITAARCVYRWAKTGELEHLVRFLFYARSYSCENEYEVSLNYPIEEFEPFYYVKTAENSHTDTKEGDMSMVLKSSPESIELPLGLMLKTHYADTDAILAWLLVSCEWDLVTSIHV